MTNDRNETTVTVPLIAALNLELIRAKDCFLIDGLNSTFYDFIFAKKVLKILYFIGVNQFPYITNLF